ncbi:MAG: hypothetical protein LQ346_004249 [Caloplaca aetnensis]|nr:MAG: hypothetical protein LQ346_004249 [Caloplaca aetnensis]
MAGHLCFSCSQPAVPSIDGAVIAIIDRSQLLVRSSETGHVQQVYDLPPGFATSCRFIRWYQQSGIQRVLLADDARIVVYDISKPQMYAEITGANGLTKLANVDFGRTHDEVMVFSDFGFKLQIWALTSKRAIEIKDPKSVLPCYSYRSTTGHLALLTRPASHDILMIVAPQTHEVLETVELSTIDAGGVMYSPNGNWLAVWDTASAGCRVLVLTADGHLFKTYSLPQNELNLGVRSVQWNPGSDFLAVGDNEGTVTVLRANTFTPRMTFTQPATIESPHGSVWQEEIGPSRTRGYAEAKQPATSPSNESFRSVKEGDAGTSILEFNIDGTLLATKSNDTPSTLRIVSPQSGELVAALIHHAPIRAIRWHDRHADLLLIQCAIRDPTIYVWRASWSSPRIFSVSIKPPFGRLAASWLSSDEGNIRYMLTNSEQLAFGQFTPDGAESQANRDFINGLGPEDMFDEGHSLDLSTARLLEHDTMADDTAAPGLSTQLGFTSAVEDTFHYRRPSQAVP